jgi:hypothetical protein
MEAILVRSGASGPELISVICIFTNSEWFLYEKPSSTVVPGHARLATGRH